MPQWIREAELAFQAIFEGMGISSPRRSAIYYIYLIKNSPTSFSKLVDDAKSKSLISAAKLRQGRENLMDMGIVGKVLLPHGLSQNEINSALGREFYLPANPSVVWDSSKNKLLKEFDETAIERMCEEISCLFDIYTKKFGHCGINLDLWFNEYNVCKNNGVGKLSMTLHYSGMWVVYNILSNMKTISNLDLMLGGERTFDDSQMGYFRQMLNNNLKIRILFDERNGNQIKNAKILKDDYDGLIKIKYNPRPRSGTCRRTILDNKIAFDGRKLLQDYGRKPSYVGTMYLHDEYCIGLLQDNFNALWDEGEELE